MLQGGRPTGAVRKQQVKGENKIQDLLQET